MTNDGQGAAAPRLNETLKAALEQRFGERFSVVLPLELELLKA